MSAPPHGKRYRSQVGRLPDIVTIAIDFHYVAARAASLEPVCAVSLRDLYLPSKLALPRVLFVRHGYQERAALDLMKQSVGYLA